MAHPRRHRQSRGLSQHSGKQYYTTVLGSRLQFDIENEIDTGEDRDIDFVQDPKGQARQGKQVVADLLRMGSESQGVSPAEWVVHASSMQGYRLSINQSMSVFNAAATQDFLSDDPGEAAGGTEDLSPRIGKGDQPFGRWDL